MDMWEELDAVEKAKEEYLTGEIVMSELLRNEEYSELTPFSKAFLLKWAGEDDIMKVTKNGDIVTIVNI